MLRMNRLDNALRGRNGRRSLRPRLEGLEERLVLSSAGNPATLYAHPTFVLKMTLNAAGQSVPSVTPGPSGLYPSQLVTAYGLGQISFNGLKGDGTGQTIVIVDAYDNPNFVNSTDPNFATSALHIFDQQFGLPDPPSFTKVNQNGQASPLPPADAPGGWGAEIALDIEWAHAIAPGANIILVEGNDASTPNLIQTAAATAGTLGSVVSMSFGLNGNTGVPSLDPIFIVPNVTYLASTDDVGSPGSYPAYSPNVVAVGGTTLNGLNANGDYPGTGANGETGWSGGGGGISTVEAEPSFQRGVQNTGFRSIPDISAEADPNTGVAVYDPYDFGTSAPWGVVGGTSLACPMMAAMISIVDQGRVHYGGQTLSSAQTENELYSLFATNNSDFHDIVLGNNGGYNAGPGYDEVTGLGTPNGSQLVPDMASFGLYANLKSIAVTPAAPSVAAGLTQQFTAIGTFPGGKTIDVTNAVTWSSNTPSVATIVTGGLASALTQGSSVITASLNGIFSPGDTLTVTAPLLASIAVTPSNPLLARGASTQFIATGTYSDKSIANLTSQVIWTSASPSIATVSSSGIVRAVSMGSTAITASLGNIISPTDPVIVTAPALSSIVIGPINQTVALGVKEQFTATGTYSDGTIVDITRIVNWDSTSPAVATVALSGLATTLSVGTTQITARLSGVNSLSDPLTVVPVSLTSIVLSPSTTSLAKGLTEKLTATGSNNDGTTVDLSNQVTWASSSPTVATIDASGNVQSLGLGSTNLTATYKGITIAPATLSVTPALLTSIVVGPNNPSVPKGLNQQFTATGKYTDGTTIDLTKQVTWASDSPTFASISSTGLAPGLGTGAAGITATYNNVTSQSDTLLVTDPVLTSIALTPPTSAVAAGLSQQFTAIGTYTDGSQQNVTTKIVWTSNNASAARVTQTGLATGSAIGNSTISASVGTVSTSSNLTVLKPLLSLLNVTPGTASVAKGLTQQYHAQGVYTDGSQQDLTNSVTWSSGNAGLATISPSGLESGTGLGQTTISATLGSISGRVSSTITPAILTSLAIQPNMNTLSFNKQQQYHAIGTYSDGSQANLDNTVAWAASNRALASISTTGLATSAGNSGVTFLSAGIGNIQQTSVLYVGGTAPVLTSVSPVQTKAGTTSLVLHFKAPLDTNSAVNLANYSLLGSAKPGQPYTVSIAVKSVVYNSKTNTVTLILKKAYAGKIQVNVLSGLSSAAGV